MIRRGGGGGKRIRAALFLGVGLGMTGLALVAYGANVFQQLEFDSIDTRFDIRGAEDPPPELVNVLIDDVTLDELNLRWPFPRTLHARVIDRMRTDGARAVIYDIQFTEPSRGPRAVEEDNALIEAVAAFPDKVTLATTEVNERGESKVFGGGGILEDIGARSGNANLVVDEGGVVRRMPYEVDGLKSFSLTGAEIVADREIERSELGDEPFWIDYAGPPGTIPHVSFSHVITPGKLERGFFKDKVVVVGPSAPSLQDVHTTAAGEEMPGAELQANAVSTALRDFPLRSTPRWLDLLLILAMGVLAPLASLRLRITRSLLVAIVVAAGFIVATQLLFNAGWVIPFVYPFLALTLSTVGALGAYYVLSAFERQRVHDTFARFVPETVVDQVLAEGGSGLTFATKEVYGTCMFTDIRGFTTFSEGHDAPQVIDVLNRYLAEMSDAILSHGGTLASFLGDGFMAVFGAPIEQDDHADRALAAAREIADLRLPRFNEALRAEGWDEFKMGIGLNSGQFMSGNVGSEQRLQYTVIGDTINTASRIEGLTKGTPYIMLMAESTREALQDPPSDLIFVDEFEIRGRQGRVKLWSVGNGDRPESAPEPTAVVATEGGR